MHVCTEKAVICCKMSPFFIYTKELYSCFTEYLIKTKMFDNKIEHL